MRMSPTTTVHNQPAMFLDCSQQSHLLNSKRPSKTHGIPLGQERGKENISSPHYLKSHFSARMHEIWLSQPVSPAMPQGHVRWTGRLDM